MTRHSNVYRRGQVKYDPFNDPLPYIPTQRHTKQCAHTPSQARVGRHLPDSLSHAQVTQHVLGTAQYRVERRSSMELHQDISQDHACAVIQAKLTFSIILPIPVAVIPRPPKICVASSAVSRLHFVMNLSALHLMSMGRASRRGAHCFSKAIGPANLSACSA